MAQDSEKRKKRARQEQCTLSRAGRETLGCWAVETEIALLNLIVKLQSISIYFEQSL
jgi:hypothetical protein